MGIFKESANATPAGAPLPHQPSNRDDSATGLSEDGAILVHKKYGKVGMVGDPDVMDERLDSTIELRPWTPSGAGENLDDYTKVRPVPGLNAKATRKRLEELGVGRDVAGVHGDLMEPKDRIGPFTGFVRDVLISARARYYWVGATDRAGRPVGCPFHTGPNNEISRSEFEKVRGL